MPQSRRKPSSKKKEEAEKPQESLSESPDERPEADPSQPSEEQEVNQSPAQEQPPEETDQERFDRENREADESGEEHQRGRASWRRQGTKPEGDDDEEDGTLSEYQPRHRPLEASTLDQHAFEAERTAERDAEREEHNRRTGDASLPKTDQAEEPEEQRGGRKVGKSK